jgi:hypothetical protein
MSTSYVSRKLKTYSAKNFKDSFQFSTANNKPVGYIFIGKSTEYANESNPDIISNTIENEKNSWDTMLAAKKVVSGDVEFVIPIQRWTANTRYMQYDDQCDLDILLSGGMDGNTAIGPMYVINSENNVYKCLCNNVNALSQVEPTGNYSENDGFIQTETGPETCYLWKYMYNIRESNKFYTDEWMPVPFTIANTSSNDYDLSTINLVDGALAKIAVTNVGTGYAQTSVNVSTFSVTQSLLTITDPINLGTSNIKVDMAVSGTGILQGTYITGVFPANNRILLSTPTIGSGGGSSNSISITTRVAIEGDGTGTIAQVRIGPNTEIEKVDVITIGSGYSVANVIIYGSGTGATARAILPPKFGHGSNPAMELGANNIMIVQRIGEVDATENGLIPTDTSFRQYGLILGAYKYDESVPLNDATANSVISQTKDLTVLAGASYDINEFVYQGISNTNTTFSGYVVSQSSNVIKLTETKGTPEIGRILVGDASATNRPLASVKNPDLKPYAGDVIYAENIVEVERSDGQAEEIKLVFKF